MPCTPNPDRPRADELFRDEKPDPYVSVRLTGNTTRLARWRDLTAVEIVENPPPTTDPPTPVRTYDFAHGLVVRPAYWEPAVWLRPDGTRVVLATELKGDGVHVRVTFPEGALLPSDIGQPVALWFRATVGRPA